MSYNDEDTQEFAPSSYVGSTKEWAEFAIQEWDIEVALYNQEPYHTHAEVEQVINRAHTTIEWMRTYIQELEGKMQDD